MMPLRFARSGEVGLAELIEAMAILRPGAEVAERVAGSLGFAWRCPESAATGVAGALSLPPTALDPRGTVPELRADRRAPVELQPVRPASRSFELAPPRGAVSFGTGLLAPSTSPGTSMKAPYQPLFRDQWWRALAQAMLATPTASGEIDMRIIARHLRTGRPIDALPWCVKKTLRRGVVLVLDRSESMQPFRRDQRELAERCTRVIGAAGVQAYWVETDECLDPGSGLRWLQREPESLAPRTPLVIVSDFELAREMAPRWPLLAPWRPLIDRARAAGAPVLALIPLARTLWPTALSAELPDALEWDVDTTINAVRHLRLRRG